MSLRLYGLSSFYQKLFWTSGCSFEFVRRRKRLGFCQRLAVLMNIMHLVLLCRIIFYSSWTASLAWWMQCNTHGWVANSFFWSIRVTWKLMQWLMYLSCSGTSYSLLLTSKVTDICCFLELSLFKVCTYHVLYINHKVTMHCIWQKL